MLAMDEWKRRIFLDLLHIIFTNFLDLKLACTAGRKANVSTDALLMHETRIFFFFSYSPRAHRI